MTTRRKTRIRTGFIFSLFVLVFLLFLLAFLRNDFFPLASPSPSMCSTLTINNQFPDNTGCPEDGSIGLGSEGPPHSTVTGFIQPGESFYSLLLRHGFPSPVIARFVDAYKPIFNCRNLSPGETYEIITDEQDNLVSLSIETTPFNTYELRQEGEELVAVQHEIVPDKRIAVISGVIDGSLFNAITSTGESDILAIMFADIFVWDIDFRHDLRKGDEFKIIFETYYKDDTFIEYSKILAAEYRSRSKIHRAVFFQDPEGQKDYYTPEGRSLRRSFLRSPLRFTRISSGYSHRRFHPVLKRYQPHLGIDFAAPTGTPVWAVADGVVIKKGWKNGNGNMVTVRHPNGYETMYNHLSRYAKGIKIGTRLRQKDIIGYVGATGLATGPHLDYRMKKNGRFINPLAEEFPPGSPVKDLYRDKFLEVSHHMIVLLDQDEPRSVKIAADF
ncbi:MAG: peptidoglycan DD-metalloendopeptidase family protein [Deltaproteobacteria bacterium]|nr:peptidoglycan DD-metalloendopeptidase family protein [Deltaproteobacteria bacterium]